MQWTHVAFLVGRLLFGGFFVFAGINHFTSLDMLAAAAGGQGVPFPRVAIMGTGLLLLLGGASVIAGLAPRIGLAFLITFLVGVTPVMHGFWAIADGAEAQLQLAFFLRNLAFLGACLALYAVPHPWVMGVGGAVGTRHRERRARRVP